MSVMMILPAKDLYTQHLSMSLEYNDDQGHLPVANKLSKPLSNLTSNDEDRSGHLIVERICDEINNYERYIKLLNRAKIYCFRMKLVFTVLDRLAVSYLYLKPSSFFFHDRDAHRKCNHFDCDLSTSISNLHYLDIFIFLVL